MIDLCVIIYLIVFVFGVLISCFYTGLTKTETLPELMLFSAVWPFGIIAAPFLLVYLLGTYFHKG